MRCVVGGVALALLAISGSCAEEAAGTSAASPPSPSLLFFSGADMWQHGAFAHGGLLWSPSGLEREGFTLKLLVGSGTYRYRSGALRDAEVTGVMSLGAAMPGWRFKFEKLEITVAAGLDLQHHLLIPNDPDNDLRGLRYGLRVGGDLWYEPFAAMMLAANVSASSIGPSYWTRVAAGWRMLDRFWLGPEALALGDPTYHQWRAGIHVTSFRTGTWEWSGGVGFVMDSDDRRGIYGRIGILTRR